MSVKVPTRCTRCATVKVNGRCPRCPLPAGERRAYSDTSKYREVLAAVLERDGAVCAYCSNGIDGVTIEPRGPRGGVRITVDRRAADPLTLAHVIPHDAGGRFEVDNIRPAHDSCNKRAGNTPMAPDASL